jgi:hypothetical protein
MGGLLASRPSNPPGRVLLGWDASNPAEGYPERRYVFQFTKYFEVC